MRTIDRLKKDRETLRSLKDRKAKVTFIWDYYKIPILVIVLALTLGIYGTIRAIRDEATLFHIVLVNSDAQILEADESVFSRLLANGGVTTEGKKADVNDYLTLGLSGNEEDDVETLQVLNALFTITDLDLFVGYQDNFDKFIAGDAFLDLSEVLDAELLKENEGRLYRYTDSNGNAIIGGIILPEDSPLHKARYYHSEVIIGIAANAVYKDNAAVFIRELLKD